MVAEQPELTTIVGNNIRMLRKTRGLSREKMAEQLEMGANALLKVEQGSIAPRFKRLERMAKILDCSVSDFFIAPNDNTLARANSIAKMLESLPLQKQENAMHLIRQLLALIDAQNTTGALGDSTNINVNQK